MFTSVVSSQAPTETRPVRSGQDELRALVHKHARENVLLTGISQCAGDRFMCTGRLPAAHGFFNDHGRTPRRDILFYTELGRQASLAISHAFLGVSTDDVFIFEGSEAALTEAAWLTAPPDADLVVIDIAIKEITRRKNNAVTRVVAQHRMSIGDILVFHGTGACTVQPAALFHRLRRMSCRATPSAAIDEAPGRAASNVVITTPQRIDENASFMTSLVVDDTHPYFFDHPCDHVPGMLLLEACAQLAVEAFAGTNSLQPSRTAISAYEVNFAQFVERGLPATLVARVNHNDDVEVAISQPDVVCGTTTMRIAFPV